MAGGAHGDGDGFDGADALGDLGEADLQGLFDGDMILDGQSGAMDPDAGGFFLGAQTVILAQIPRWAADEPPVQLLKNGLFLLAYAGTILAQATTAPVIGADKANLSFAYTIGAAKLPAAQTVNIKSTPAGLSYTLAVSGPLPYQGAWLLPGAYAGRAPQALPLQVNPTGLPAGSYTATVTVTATSGSPAPVSTFTVTLAVGTPAPSITTSPSALTFTYTTGMPVANNGTLVKSFLLSNTGSAIPATVSVTGAPWLKITPTGNITLAGLLNTITATVDPTGLQPKAYTGTIKIESKQAATPTVNVAVTLTVQAAVPAIASTWPASAIQQSPALIATFNGSDFFATTTAAAVGFTSGTMVSVTDGANTATEIFHIPVYAAASTALRVAMGSPLPGGQVGGTMPPVNLEAAGGTGNYSWSVTGGALPPGLSIAGTTLAGAPSTPGIYYFTLQVQDESVPAPKRAYMPMKMTILPAGTPSQIRILGPNMPLPAATVGTAYGTTYSVQLLGGSSGVNFTATGLPPGLTLGATTGALGGTPTTIGITGPLTATVVSDRAMLVTLPAAMLTTPGILRVAVTTPAPGGGASNEAQFVINGPEPQILAVVNSASLTQGKISPGEVVTLFGLGLGPNDLTLFDPTPGTIPTTLGTTSIKFNGTDAPLLYTSANQLAAIVPYLITGPNVDVTVTNGGSTSQPFTVAFAATNPGVFTTTTDGKGQAALLNYVAATGDYVLNSSANPALKGQTVVLYLNGAGTTTAPSVTALTPATPAVTPNGAVSVTVGGQAANVSGAVAVPGSVPGLIQVNFVIPNNAPTGQAVPIAVTVDGVESQAGVTASIK